MKKILRDSKGFALLLSILVVGLIVSLTVQFNTAMRAELYSAANVRDGIMLGVVARSGIDLARAVLAEDASANSYDTLREDWADSEVLSVTSGGLFEEGRFELRIDDHSGKICVNRLVNTDGSFNPIQKEVFRRFLLYEGFGLDEEEVDNLLDAFKDWLDEDDEVTRFGAERTYYETGEQPCTCRNGPIETLEEMLLIRGMSDELFYGKDERFGIAPFLTVRGDGHININTAALPVLWALSEQIDMEMAESMIAYRQDEDNDVSTTGWYKQVSGMSDVSLDNDLVAVTSVYFEIRCDAFRDELRRRVSATVERDGTEVRVLSWKVE